ncbi:putative disease resistance protein RGA4 isoform X2 [Punica granatum]|uniref:Disease resistance protein RGA4 isoform X2 n=1 Tax=Punica granatum TaxID=22663 RepID=A0A6P8BPJ3_PUNGR|nr:putative disease resistance protein RGA4 isoform X2 [Punica granatum]
MADLILGSIVDSITEHLVSLVAQEIGLISGVKRELEKLRGTVSAIAALLREAEKRRIEAEDVKDWLQRLKVVVYDADDLLDDFSTEALRRRRVVGGVKRVLNEVRIFLSSSNQLVSASTMAHRVKEIRERIDGIKSDRSDFKVEGNDGSTLGVLVENQLRPETYPYKPERYVVGRDEDTKEVIDILLNPDFEENVSTLPIVGIGGLGKTTLARLVFNNASIKEYFSVKLWVCVSTNFDAEEIVRKIVGESTLGKDELTKKLGEKLDGKKFLLVLDDLWNENRSKWLELEEFLMNGAKGSKILVTTRHLKVVKTMTPPKCHELKGLPEDQSLALLMRMAGKQEYEWKSQNLEEIAKEILKKCVGVPLAIKTIGRLLVFLRNKEEWLNFKNNELSRIDHEEGDIMPSLKLSYDFLPSHLKQCFAYCCLFPKDYELDTSELIHLWMAQGFIKPLGNRKTQLEEVGHDYFMELLSRSFFQDIVEDRYGNIVRCKMHDLMHDLAQSVAGDNCITIDSSHEKSIPPGARHVSTDDPLVLKSRFEGGKRLRSLLFTKTFGNFRELIHLDVSCFRNLRALRIRNARINVISGSIGKLKHMRSLDLSWNPFQYLPNSISGLCNLETLNLRGCPHLQRLPRGLTKLVNLRQLDVSECDKLTHLPRGIGKLTNLQMLGEFKVGKDSIRDAAGLNELSKLTGLRKELTIQCLERSVPSGLEASFSIEKLALQSLKLDLYPSQAMEADAEVLERLRPHPDLKKLSIKGYGGVQPSSWISQLHKLVEIKFRWCYQCVRLPPLDQLPSLKRVSLIGLINLQWIELSESESGTPQSISFPSLEEIRLEDLLIFRGWERRRRSRSSSRIEQEEEAIQEEVEVDDDSLLMLPFFSDNVEVATVRCPTFSYMHGQGLHLKKNSTRIIKELVRNVTIRHTPASSSSRMMATLISPSSISLLAPTSLTISEVEDLEHLPVVLLQSLPSIQSLAIKDCPRLKALPVWAILRYLTALKSLKISRCPELDLSTGESGYQEDMPEGPAYKLQELKFGWISQRHKLVEIEFRVCHNCMRLPPLDQLPSLKRIHLFRLRNLRCIELSESESGTPQSNSFPSLEEIRLEDLPKFRGWERRRSRSRSSSRIEQEEEAIQEEVEEDDDSLLMLPMFSDKVKVTTSGCPTFSYMHGQELHLKKTSTRIIKELVRNVTTRHASASSSSSSTSSSSRMMATLISISSISLLALTGLTISEVEDLEHLPVELLQSLPSLQSLEIWGCSRLKAPPVWAILRYLTALKSLTISLCPELELSTGESGYQEDMPEGPAYKLRELKFGWNREVETLPWWIQHLTNLESLGIGCRDLKAFPEWFPQLTSLKRLEISDCGEELRRRCRRNIGEDWPKISHIPKIYVGSDWNWALGSPQEIWGGFSSASTSGVWLEGSFTAE